MSEPRTTDVAPPRVLVVDDDAMVRELLKLTLEGAGCNVAVAGDGRQALEACEASRPDLIVSDIEMPGMDGLELLKTVRGDDRLRDVPMIMLSRRGEMADVVHGLSLGADDYIAKPFKVPEVIARVQSKLQRRPVPIDRLRHDLQTDALTQQAFKHELERELTRIRRNGGHCAVAAIATADMQLMGTKLSTREVAEVTAQMVQIVAATSRTTDLIGSDGDARLLLLL
ncbi:MAG: response regulator, partial [Candidatus Nanopelagicales bacterium]|nr:response regulator [Candidatus Nanopelagicales bacterium]